MAPGSGKHLLVTGGAGFIGSHVIARALKEDFEVTVVDNLYTGAERNISEHRSNPKFHFILHNVQNPFPDHLTCSSRRFSYIIHLACPASPVHYQNDPIGTVLTTVNGTHHVLQLATQHDCPVLIASTSEVYGDAKVNPQTEDYWGNVSCTGVRSCYDESKRCAESLCFDFHRQFGTKIRVARIFNTYGPHMCFNDGRIISNFIVQALRGDDITVYGTGEFTRSFQYVEDLVEGFWRLMQHPTEIGPVNLGNPEEYSVLEMAQKAIELVPGTRSTIKHFPPASDDPQQRRPDISKAERVLNGWHPRICVKEGLQRTMEDFKKRLDAGEI